MMRERGQTRHAHLSAIVLLMRSDEGVASCYDRLTDTGLPWTMETAPARRERMHVLVVKDEDTVLRRTMGHVPPVRRGTIENNVSRHTLLKPIIPGPATD